MGWRYWRRVALLPGVRLNLTLHGASMSFGHRGAWLTLGRAGRRTATLGFGGGLRYTTTSRAGSVTPRQGVPPATNALWGAGVVLVVLVAAIVVARLLAGA